MSRVLNSYEQGGFSDGKNTPSTNAWRAHFISQSCRTTSNAYYRLYTRSAKRITRADVLRLSGAARAPVALGNLLVFLLWRVGSRLLHNCHYCFALCLTRRPRDNAYRLLSFTLSLLALPATPYKRSGKTRTILAYAPYREGEVADVNGNVGSGRIFSILWSLNSNSSGQGWDFGTLVCSEIAGPTSARPPRASRNFRRLLSGKLHGRPAGCHEYPRLVTQSSVRSHFPLFRGVHEYGVDNARVTYLPGPSFCAAQIGPPRMGSAAVRNDGTACVS